MENYMKKKKKVKKLGIYYNTHVNIRPETLHKDKENPFMYPHLNNIMI